MTLSKAETQVCTGCKSEHCQGTKSSRKCDRCGGFRTTKVCASPCLNGSHKAMTAIKKEKAA
jgi:hypothetical protein